MIGIETRTFDRDSLYVCGEMTTGEPEISIRIKVRNLSAGGMMAVCDDPVRPGQEAVFGLPNIGRVRGKILWVEGRRFGTGFEQQIDPRLARQQPHLDDREAPRFARAAIFARPHGTKSGEKLSV